jgi:hypothetical protein
MRGAARGVGLAEAPALAQGSGPQADTGLDPTISVSHRQLDCEQVVADLKVEHRRTEGWEAQPVPALLGY